MHHTRTIQQHTSNPLLQPQKKWDKSFPHERGKGEGRVAANPGLSIRLRKGSRSSEDANLNHSQSDTITIKVTCKILLRAD